MDLHLPEDDASADGVAGAAGCRARPAPGAPLTTILPGASLAALRVLEVETRGLQALARALGGDQATSFARAVELVANCNGRVVVTGMGKSGLIGRKIAATLASTGTLATFVHPADASHGDLGMVTRGDVLLALSGSGETHELRAIVAHADRLAIPLVAVTARAGSTLDRKAAVTIILPPAPEACPLGLAPTTSTTMMLTLGDALAVALMERKGVTAEDFHLRHPGGRLGHRLARVVDVMGVHDGLPLVAKDAGMGEVILAMSRSGEGIAGVIDGGGKLIGSITEADLRRHMDPRLLLRRADDVMGEASPGLTPDMAADEALRRMAAAAVRIAFVLEDGRPVGILRLDDGRRAA